MRVRQLPQPGDKQYFADEKIVSAEVVGGVTLNHLSWAAVLGAPTALLALQGNDAYGLLLRKKLQELGVVADHVRCSDEYATSVSYILSAPDGERTIIMAPASTSRLTRAKMEQEYANVVSQASMITTEISQLPLSGVEFLLDAAVSRGVPSLVDVDVTPETAIGPARLGTAEELRRCLGKATVLKLTGSAVPELIALAGRPALSIEHAGLDRIAAELAGAFGARLCVITDGARGAALALSAQQSAYVTALPGVTQIDATGAGDAFFGGVVAAMHAWGLPASKVDLERMGRVASAAGAACVEVVGALPVLGKRWVAGFMGCGMHV
jgi:sugar/nucleoside kinase (ribokinase family)